MSDRHNDIGVGVVYDPLMMKLKALFRQSTMGVVWGQATNMKVVNLRLFSTIF